MIRDIVREALKQQNLTTRCSTTSQKEAKKSGIMLVKLYDLEHLEFAAKLEIQGHILREAQKHGLMTTKITVKIEWV